MKPYYQQGKWAIYYGDCREVLPTLPKASAIVTDPPYELGFMGKSWDSKGISFQKETWGIVREACLPGTMLLSFGGTRTFHRIACAIEDAGWEIRDTVMWVYGSGFPKSLDVSKAIDYDACKEQLTEKLGRKPTKDELKGAWVEFRGVISKREGTYADIRRDTETGQDGLHGGIARQRPRIESFITAPATPEAQLWEGYGTALKPAYEPIILAMNPLDGTFANNALKHGVAGLNIDECRVGIDGGETHKGGFGSGIYGNSKGVETDLTPKGRFPANFIHDGSQMVMELFPETNKSTDRAKYVGNKYSNKGATGGFAGGYQGLGYTDNGSAARFFRKCEIDLSDLCFTLRYDTMSVCKIIYVHTAERLLGIIQAIIENTAPLNAEGLQNEGSAPLVKSAVSHADLCEILTALVLARIKTLASSPETLQAIRDYTSNFKECIQLLNLVFSAEIQANIDITQITTSLLTSFGYVNPATTDCIPAIEKSEPRRFLYTPKASKAERDRGCEDLEPQQSDPSCKEGNPGGDNPRNRGVNKVRNNHPTVKPLSLVTYLVKLVKMPEYNLVIDSFMGSGTTLLACIRLGIPCIGIDNDEKSCEIAARRCCQEAMELV